MAIEETFKALDSEVSEAMIMTERIGHILADIEKRLDAVGRNYDAIGKSFDSISRSLAPLHHSSAEKSFLDRPVAVDERVRKDGIRYQVQVPYRAILYSR